MSSEGIWHLDKSKVKYEKYHLNNSGTNCVR